MSVLQACRKSLTKEQTGPKIHTLSGSLGIQQKGDKKLSTFVTNHIFAVEMHENPDLSVPALFVWWKRFVRINKASIYFIEAGQVTASLGSISESL